MSGVILKATTAFLRLDFQICKSADFLDGLLLPFHRLDNLSDAIIQEIFDINNIHLDDRDVIDAELREFYRINCALPIDDFVNGCLAILKKYMNMVDPEKVTVVR
jgi:hypothetical protein